MPKFPDDGRPGECKDCTYFESFEETVFGHCEKIHGFNPIHNWPIVHETCWCSFFEEDV